MLLNYLLSVKISDILIAIVGVVFILGLIIGVCRTHKKKSDSPAQNGAPVNESSNNTTDNDESPANQGSSTKKKGCGDTNGNGAKCNEGAEVHVIKIPSIVSDIMMFRDNPFGSIFGAIRGLHYQMMRYTAIQAAAELFIQNHDEGAYNDRPTEIRTWICELISAIKNRNSVEENDVTDEENIEFLHLHVLMLRYLTHIDSLNDMDLEIWIEWLTLIEDKQRVMSDLGKIKEIADSYLEKNKKTAYFYVMRLARRTAVSEIKIEVPGEIQNLFLVSEQLRDEFFAFDMTFDEGKHFEEAIMRDRLLQLNAISKEMARELERGAYDGKPESVKLLIGELLDQKSKESVCLDKQHYWDVVTLLGALRDAKNLDEINPEMWINYLKWCEDDERVRENLTKIRDIADGYLRKGMVKPYLFIIYYAKMQFSGFKCKIPDEIWEAFKPESKFECTYEDFSLSCALLGDTWDSVTRMADEYIDNE